VNIKSSILLRVRLAFLLVFLFALAIIYKIIDLQMIEGEKWNMRAAQTGLQYMTMKAPRGNIFSDNGSLLATSVPYYKVALDPSRVTDEIFQLEIDTLTIKLTEYFGEKSPSDYKRFITNARVSGKKYILLSRKQINYQEKKKMEQWPILKYGRLKGGALFEKVEKRFLPFSYLATRTIGYVNDNYEGAGLEYSFNNKLAGKNGKALFRKMSGGSWKPVRDGSDIRPVDGYDLQTTIDINLQDVAESALLRALENHNADHGSLILMHVKTGEIKAISNLSRTRSGNYAETYNYAVGRNGLREPGSTFKLATMIALLEENEISLEDSIETGNGIYKVYDNVVRDHEEGGYGTITIREAFEKSSNVAMAKLVERQFGANPHLFYQYLVNMKLTEPIGFQMIGEGVPKISKPDEWSGITLQWMAYGYGLELTPLHILTLYNAVANNGRMIKPIIVKSIKRADRIVEEFSTETIIRRIASEKTLRKIKSLLEGVVKNGTAKSIDNNHYKIAGKTGTAQLLINGRHSKTHMTSFVGYFPADEPLFSCIVVIENPKGFSQYGSNVAAPVFKEVADKIYASNIDMHKPLTDDFKREMGVFPVIQSGLQSELKMICNELGISNHSESDELWVKTRRSSNSVLWKDKKFTRALIPDVTGMTLRDAIYVLENRGLKVSTEGRGRVKKQSQLPGMKIVKGEQIKLILG